MFQELAQHLYIYIMQAEIVLLRFFKINPFEIMRQITLIDLDAYLKRIQKEEEEESKSWKQSDLMKCLRGANEYLNLIFHKQK